MTNETRMYLKMTSRLFQAPRRITPPDERIIQLYDYISHNLMKEDYQGIPSLYVALVLSEGLKRFGTSHRVVRGFLNIETENASFLHFWIEVHGKILDNTKDVNLTIGVCPKDTIFQYSLHPLYDLVDEDTTEERSYKRVANYLFRLFQARDANLWKEIFEGKCVKLDRRVSKFLVKILDHIHTAN
jgi:hypothetical protein